MGVIYQLCVIGALFYAVQGQGMLQRMLVNSQQNRASNNIVEPKPQFGNTQLGSPQAPSNTGNSNSLSSIMSALNNLRRRQDMNSAQMNNRISTKEQPSSMIQWQAAQSRNQFDVTTPPDTANNQQSSIRISINRKNDAAQNSIDSNPSFAAPTRPIQNSPKNVQPISASLAHLLRSMGRNGVSSAVQNRVAPSQPMPRARTVQSASSAPTRVTASGGGASSAALSNLATASAIRGQMSDMLDTHLDAMSDMAEAGMLGMPGMGGFPSMGMPGMGMNGLSRFAMSSRRGSSFGMLPFGAFS